MRIAVLCNGPSRVDYTSSLGYDYVIGCNVPWTEVDATVVLDEIVIDLWSKTPDLITVPVYFSRKAWMYTDSIKKRSLFEPYLIEILDILPDFDSSGHNAVKCAIRKGASEVDVYGCDSWFEQTIVSHSHKYFKNLNPDDSAKHVNGWRKRWKEIMDGSPDVKINFIRKEK
jgi:hypothetical protein